MQSPEQLESVQEMAFGKEGSPSRVELLKAAMVMYSLARPKHPQLEGFSEWIECFRARLETGTPRLSFWAAIQANTQLADRVSDLLDQSTLLTNLLKGFLDPSGHDSGLAYFFEKWPMGTLDHSSSNGPLPAIFSTRWVLLQELQDRKFDRNVEQQKVHLAVICAKAATYLPGDSLIMPTIDDIVELLNAFELPVLGRNKHDKK
ncbi:hypothetical protein FN846DRAFT_239320 [Sphaerosporella brunnea]|uniref:Uncharacterized protein n=1 Tax=Sphaerosporella brunnea TaxID=1250544 RepID=A0A5J5FB99_9PEZI|nr:hypothetical protein FN846DRAFT_239320 [Sphaerosporella brunnea]